MKLFTLIQTAYAADTKATISQVTAPIISYIVNPILLLMTALAGFYFIWGVIGLIWGVADSDKRKEAQNHALYGVLGLFVMVSAYGIIRLIAASIGIQDDPFSSSGFQGF